MSGVVTHGSLDTVPDSFHILSDSRCSQYNSERASGRKNASHLPGRHMFSRSNNSWTVTSCLF